MHQDQAVDVAELLGAVDGSAADDGGDEGEEEDRVCVESARNFAGDEVVGEPGGEPDAVDADADADAVEVV